MKKALICLFLAACNHPKQDIPTDSTIVIDGISKDSGSQVTPIDASIGTISCLTHSAITTTKALVVVTVSCPPTDTYQAQISIFDKNGFACGSTGTSIPCGQSYIFECSSSSDLETVIIKYALNGAINLMDCPIAKR